MTPNFRLLVYALALTGFVYGFCFLLGVLA
jgi:hypothetical protein